MLERNQAVCCIFRRIKQVNCDLMWDCVLAPQMQMVQNVVADINRRTGESECQHYKDRLLYSEDGQRDELIDRSKTISCHGELKNNRGLVSVRLHFTPEFSSSRLTFSTLFQMERIKKKKKNFCPSAETPRVSVPGRLGHHQVGFAQQPAGQLPALPPANPHSPAGPGGYIRW